MGPQPWAYLQLQKASFVVSMQRETNPPSLPPPQELHAERAPFKRERLGGRGRSVVDVETLAVLPSTRPPARARARPFGLKRSAADADAADADGGNNSENESSALRTGFVVEYDDDDVASGGPTGSGRRGRGRARAGASKRCRALSVCGGGIELRRSCLL